MAPLERLFLLEVEFARKLRTEAPGTSDVSSLHTSYALQAGYESLIAAAGRVTVRDVEAVGDASSARGGCPGHLEGSRFAHPALGDSAVRAVNWLVSRAEDHS